MVKNIHLFILNQFPKKKNTCVCEKKRLQFKYYPLYNCCISFCISLIRLWFAFTEIKLFSKLLWSRNNLRNLFQKRLDFRQKTAFKLRFFHNSNRICIVIVSKITSFSKQSDNFLETLFLDCLLIIYFLFRFMTV